MPPPQFKFGIFGLAVVALLMQVAFGSAEGPATTQGSEIPDLEALYEKAFRDLPEFVNYKRTRFIAVGFDPSGYPIDPPPTLLPRFTDLKGQVKPVSKAKRVGKIRDENGRPGIWHIADPETGKRTRLFFLVIRDRRADGGVFIDVGFMSGPLSGGGRGTIYRFVEGEWKLERVTSGFVS